MRLAVIADIHGNVAALEAVLADVKARGADGIVNLGDCVSGPLWPRETMDLLDAVGLPTVRGNHDRWVAETPRESMYPSYSFAFDRLTPSQRTALGALPARVDLGAISTGVVLCAHSHQPRIAHGPGGLLIVNPGSVGCPAYADPTPPSPHVSETGSPHARYVLLAREAGCSWDAPAEIWRQRRDQSRIGVV